MSLTSYVADLRIRSILKEHLPKPRAETRNLVTANVPSTGNPQLVGTAFDYLLRFELQRRHPRARTKPWVAQSSLGLQAHLLRIVPDQAIELAASMEAAFETARQRQAAFVAGGDGVRDLAASSLDLARIDVLYRAAYPPTDLGSASSDTLDELLSLLDAAPATVLGPHDDVWLNPTFGSWSLTVGGADADLVLDGLLIDIKTVKEPKLTVDNWLQLIGYTFLSELGQRDGDDVPHIDRVGVYFSRQGALWTHDLHDLRAQSTWMLARDAFEANLPTRRR